MVADSSDISDEMAGDSDDDASAPSSSPGVALFSDDDSEEGVLGVSCASVNEETFDHTADPGVFFHLSLFTKEGQATWAASKDKEPTANPVFCAATANLPVEPRYHLLRKSLIASSRRLGGVEFVVMADSSNPRTYSDDFSFEGQGRREKSGPGLFARCQSEGCNKELQLDYSTRQCMANICRHAALHNKKGKKLCQPKTVEDVRESPLVNSSFFGSATPAARPSLVVE